MVLLAIFKTIMFMFDVISCAAAWLPVDQLILTSKHSNSCLHTGDRDTETRAFGILGIKYWDRD